MYELTRTDTGVRDTNNNLSHPDSSFGSKNIREISDLEISFEAITEILWGGSNRSYNMYFNLI